MSSNNLERDILSQVLSIMSLGAMVIFLLASLRIVLEGFELKFGLMWTVALGILALKNFGGRLSGHSIVSILFAFFTTMGFIALSTDGLASIGSIFLFLGLSTGAVVLGPREFLLLILIQLSFFLFITALVSKGLIVPLPDTGTQYLLSSRTWLFHGVVIAIGGAISFYGSNILGRWYRDNLMDAKNTLYNAISVLSLARDTETGEHVDRVSKYIEILYDALDAKISEKITFTKDDISKACRLHDVGKIGISDAMLKKPGRLTKSEFQSMQRHCEIGADIISSIANSREIIDPVLRIAERIAIAHHENWDGSGYPFGLVGEDIPIEARIMAIADVYDALRSKRPYKEAYSHEEALKIMAEEQHKFDPKLYQIFLENADKFDQTFSEIN